MLVKSGLRIEVTVTEVALPGRSVPGLARGFVFRRAVPADQLLRDDAVRVLGPHELVHHVAVQGRGLRTGAALQVVREPRGADEGPLAERTPHLASAMGARVKMLRRSGQRTLKDWMNGWIDCRDPSEDEGRQTDRQTHLPS